MEKHAFYYYEDAREMAQIIINNDGGRMVEGSTDVRGFRCPRELDSWSGEIGCIFVENENGQTVAAVGYWTDVASEKEAAQERAGWLGVVWPQGRRVFEAQADGFEFCDKLQARGVLEEEIGFFDPSEPAPRFFAPDEELTEIIEHCAQCLEGARE